jgi:HK97 family phage prohead protease
MQTLDFAFNTKALSEEGAFTGKAAVYGELDLTGDIIETGAFKHAIAQQGDGYPLLWAHRQDEPVGIARIEDSANALIVKGQLLMSDPTAMRAYDHLRARTIKGLSIGFQIPTGNGRVIFRDDGVRILKEIRLLEISLVAVPAQPKAQVTEVKSLGDVRLLLKGIKAAEPEAIGELSEIAAELKRLLAKHTGEAETAVATREMITQVKELAMQLSLHRVT